MDGQKSGAIPKTVALPDVEIPVEVEKAGEAP